jgi:DNA-binding transcriptional LysR family regulator
VYDAPIDLRQLEYFVRIARSGGFRRAAEDLSVSQAALSQQMKLLEAELRAPLFERAHRPVDLTEAGTALLERAELILSELRDTREEVQAFAGLERGHVKVGTLPAHGAGWTVPMLGSFHRQHPQVDLGLAEHNSAVLLDLLRTRTIDVACMNIPASGWNPPEGVCHAPIFRFELVFAVHAAHRFGDRDRVTLEELATESLIMPPHSSLSWILDRAFARRGLRYSVGYHITDQHTLLELSAEGLGVGVSTRIGISRRPELSLRAVEVADADLTGVGVATWTERGIRNRAVQALVTHAAAWGTTSGWRDPVQTPTRQTRPTPSDKPARSVR